MILLRTPLGYRLDDMANITQNDLDRKVSITTHAYGTLKGVVSQINDEFVEVTLTPAIKTNDGTARTFLFPIAENPIVFD